MAPQPPIDTSLRRHPIEWFKTLVAEYWSSFVGWLGAIGVGIGISHARSTETATQPESGWVAWAVILIGLSIGLMLVAFIYRTRAEATRRSLINQRNEIASSLESAEQSLTTAKADIDTLVDGFLATIAKELGLTDTERVSLYRPHPEHAPDFARVGRHSTNPFYRTNGRDRYPGNCDVISKSWREGACRRQLTDPSAGSAERQRYNEQIVQNHAVSVDQVRRLSMRSIDLHGFRLSHGSAPYDAVGVVVFESTRKDALDSDQLKQTIVLHGDRLTLFIEKARPVLPNQKLADRIEQ